MKAILPILAISVSVAACNTSSQRPIVDSMRQPAQDTAGLSQFQAWKAQNELMKEYNQTQTAQYAAVAPVAAAPVASAPVRRSSGTTARRSSGGSVSSSSGNAAKAPVAQRKKISKAAKGAAIGAVGGAVAGAVINKKNRVVGGIVGGVIGGGVGYGIGRGMDKRDGRY